MLSQKDLDRQIVKSQYSTIVIPEYELTIPPSRGQLTTIEGLLSDIIRDLSGDQPLRRIQDEEAHDKIQALIDKLKVIVPDEDGVEHESGAEERQFPPFTVKLDDPSGNSWIEFEGSMADPKWSMREYVRTREQNVALSLVTEEEAEEGEAAGPIAENNEEIFTFPGICSSCSRPLDTLMKKVNIPYFKVNTRQSKADSTKFSFRISLSCRRIAKHVGTRTTRLNRGQRYPHRARRSPLKWKIWRI